MAVSENSGTPKSSILIGVSIIHHPFWGTRIFGNTHIYIYTHTYHTLGICSLVASSQCHRLKAVNPSRVSLADYCILFWGASQPRM